LFAEAEWRALKGIKMPKAMNKNGAKTKFDQYHKALEAKSEELRRSMSAQKVAQVVSRLDVPSDEGDLSQQSHEEWIFLNRNTLDLKLLREVQAALRRVQQGTYGVCAACDEPISAKRLEAVPWAKFCVQCQERIGAETAEYDDDEFDSPR
jgi:DnaK suppressor protein